MDYQFLSANIKLMDLQKQLLKEYSKAQVTKIVDYVDNDPLRFEALVEVYLKGPYRITQRASWPLSICIEHHPALILPHLKIILDHLEKPGIHDAVKRNTIRLLQFIDIPKRYQGRIAQVCFQYLMDRKEPVAIRAFSMTVLGAISMQNPGLQDELRMIIEAEMPYAKPAFLSRAKKVLKQLNR